MIKEKPTIREFFQNDFREFAYRYIPTLIGKIADKQFANEVLFNVKRYVHELSETLSKEYPISSFKFITNDDLFDAENSKFNIEIELQYTNAPGDAMEAVIVTAVLNT